MTTSRSSGGLLLAAVERGEHVPPTWADVTLSGGLTVCAATDALRAPIPESATPLRLPASFRETIAICRALGCLPPTREISDAVWAQARHRLAPMGLVRTEADERLMSTVAFTLRHNAGIEEALTGREVPEGALVADVGKDWILDNGIGVKGAVNYGWRTLAGTPLQPLGHAHDAGHHDYSQVLWLVRREARLDGEAVDLLDVLEQRGLAARWTAAYRS